MMCKELSQSNDLEDESWPLENVRPICHTNYSEGCKCGLLYFGVGENLHDYVLMSVWVLVEGWDYEIILRSKVGTGKKRLMKTYEI